MRRSDFLWDDDEVARLKKRRADGLSFGQIGREMGLTRNAVIGKAQRLGMVPSGDKPANALGPSGGSKVKQVRERAKPMNNPPPYSAPPAQAVELPAETSPMACTLQELTAASCRWPIGEAPWLFCGATKLDGYSYCERHHRLAHQKATPRLTVPMAWRAA